ncbi:MAG: hypothetical protein GY778_10085 [bacterium]|nr:hypothetical protein [bacterium]
MNNWTHEWVLYLRQSGTLMGIPLALSGLILMLGGWRLWKLAVVLTFGIIGTAVGAQLARSPDQVWLYAAIGCIVLAGVSYPPVKYSVAVLGGLIGAALVHYTITGFAVTGWALWLGSGVALAGAFALSLLHQREIIVVVTSFEGAVLIISAAVALLSTVPGLFHYFRAMAHEGSIFIPFLLLVPTVVGTMSQLADVKKRDSGLSPG